MRVRVGYERVLLLGAADEELPVVGASGLRLSGLAFFVRFGRVFESATGGEPAGASDLNRLLWVSFDREDGIGFHPLEGLDCDWEVVSWLVEEADLSEPEVAYPGRWSVRSSMSCLSGTGTCSLRMRTCRRRCTSCSPLMLLVGVVPVWG